MFTKNSVCFLKSFLILYNAWFDETKITLDSRYAN